MAFSEHFSDTELCCPHCSVNGCQQELVDALEALRAFVKLPIQILSGYRCPIHNAAIGGAKNSQHMMGNAADIKIAGMSAAEIERAARNIDNIEGIGRNDYEGWVHVDVREKPSRWCYNEQRKEIAYYPATALA